MIQTFNDYFVALLITMAVNSIYILIGLNFPLINKVNPLTKNVKKYDEIKFMVNTLLTLRLFWYDSVYKPLRKQDSFSISIFEL